MVLFTSTDCATHHSSQLHAEASERSLWILKVLSHRLVGPPTNGLGKGEWDRAAKFPS